MKGGNAELERHKHWPDLLERLADGWRIWQLPGVALANEVRGPHGECERISYQTMRAFERYRWLRRTTLPPDVKGWRREWALTQWGLALAEARRGRIAGEQPEAAQR